MVGRPHGRAEISPKNPRARGVCDRCGFMYNHYKLRWQYDWRGPKTQNLRVLVCQSCIDAYQQNGQRTIILPADPIPIMNARPEYYVPDDNPLSAIGARALPSLWQYGSQIGTMTAAGGVPAAFDSNANKPSFMSASILVSNSSYGNYVGINWSGNANSITAPSSMLPPVWSHALSSYTIVGPNDRSIGSSAYVVQGSMVDVGWGSWTTLSSGAIAGTNGETITGTALGGRYNFHRVAFLGDGVNPIYVAQVSFNVSDGSSVS